MPDIEAEKRGDGKRPFIFVNAARKLSGKAYDCDDERLIGHVIPENVTRPEEYLQNISNLIDSYVEKKGTPQLSNAETEIVTAVENTCKGANFILQPITRKKFINRKGREVTEKEKILIEIIFNNGYKSIFEMKASEIPNLIKIVGKKFPEAIVDFAEANIDKLMENEFRRKMMDTRPQTYFVDAGWQMIAGGMRYVHDSISLPEGMIAETGLNLPKIEIDKQECAKIYFESLQIYHDNRAMHVLSLYSLLGILYRCFQLAGYPPHFLLFLNGRTGSMKTTIAKILFTQLSDDRYRENPRRLDMDSTVSFERGIVKSGRDTVLLYDDYAPAKTPQKAREMKGNLETIIRMAGDGSTKSRSNANLEDIRGEGVQGMIVVTGELKGKGASSNLRCLYVEMEREYADLDVISFFQECGAAYTSVLNDFSDYVGERWREIIRFIKNEFTIKRKKLSQILRERRSVDTAATLQVAADILYRFLMEYCEISNQIANELHCEMQDSVVTVTKQSEENSREESYGVSFVKAVHELVQTGKINLHIAKPESMLGLNSFDGFYDGISYYFYLPSIYKKLTEYFKGTNRYFPLEPDEIATELFQDGISESGANGTSSSGRARRNKYWRVQIKDGKTKINFVKIRAKIFEDILNGVSIEEMQS